MNLLEAGLDILYTLMTIDNEIAETELEEIMRYLLRCGFEMADNRIDLINPEYENLVMEMGLLGAISREKLLARFERSADYFAKNTSEYQQQKMIDFALKMIAADGKITIEEKEYFNILGQRWNINTQKYIDDKLVEFKMNGEHASGEEEIAD